MKSLRPILPAIFIFAVSISFVTTPSQAQQNTTGAKTKSAAEPSEILVNGNFESGKQGWELQQVAPARGEFTITDDGPDGKPCARVELVEPGDVHWKMSLLQKGLSVKAGKNYTITFYAKANQDRWVSADFKQHLEPYKGLGGKYEVHIGTEWSKVTVELQPSDDEDTARFSIGNLGQIPGTLWFTDFSIIEE